ncbi:MAG: hypothetical protein AABX99_01295 [Nanoarchaeota archaeon]
MKNLILPGNSIGNKKWAEDLDIPDKIVWNWAHWVSGVESDFDENKEAIKIKAQFENSSINILAKSIGTFVLMKLLNLGFAPVKFILCGVPLKGIKEKGVESDYLMLSKYVPEIIIQNTHDHWGSYTEVLEFIHGINPNITVISKEADHHSYPYSDEFNKYLV